MKDILTLENRKSKWVNSGKMIRQKIEILGVSFYARTRIETGYYFTLMKLILTSLLNSVNLPEDWTNLNEFDTESKEDSFT